MGTIIFLILLYAGNALFKFDFWEMTMSRGSIANVHLLFNVACTALLLPFNKQLVKLVQKLVPGDGDERPVCVLDERFLSSPSLALEKARDAVNQMGDYAKENFQLAVDLLDRYDPKKLERLNENEVALDTMEGLLDNYLVKLTDRALTSEESIAVSELLHTLSDYERIGDYIVNLTESAQALNARGISFSSRAKNELFHLTAAVGDALNKSIACFEARSRAIALQVEPIEEVVDLMNDELKNRHVERLKRGECTVELGTQFLELIINLERISDHCSNVAMYIIRQTAPHDDIIRTDSHQYFHNLHHGEDLEFNKMYEDYREKYFAPIA